MLQRALEHTLLHTLADNVPHRIYAKDTAGRFTFANRAVADGMGAADPQELLGKTDFDFYASDAAAHYFDEEQQIMRSGCPMLNHEEHVFYSRRSGEAWLLTTKIPLSNDEGQVVGIVGINYDITERKRAEEALQEAKRLAEQAARAKSEFLAMMTHELRTPLNSVLGYVQILQRDSNLSERQLASLATIEHSGRHLLLLINDVLDTARIEGGKLELAPASVHLAEFAHVVGDIIQVKASEKRLQFRCDIDPRLPAVVTVDERRLGQVLLNLLGNAVKFTERGGITLSLHRVAACASAVGVRFEVSDTGSGLRAGDLERIFQPFEQAGDPHQRAQGTGLGLAISRQLVQAMGGEIEVRSEPGRGSVFSFDLTLPVPPVSVAHTVTVDETDIAPLVAPPEEELRTLRTLARAGNMRDISEYANHLQTLGEPYGRVARQLRLLASRCESKAIAELVQRLG
jgi:PAS domain S-box-containing protein